MSKVRRTVGILIAIVALIAGVGWLAQDWILAKVYLQVLESDGRVRSLQIDRVIEVLGIGPGSAVADIGAGTGLFSRPFAAAAAPHGVVYAVDVNDELLAHIEKTAAEQGLTNLKAVRARDDDPALPEKVDVIFMCDTLHHIGNRGPYLRNLKRHLEPGGRVAIIDFDEISPHIMPSMNYDRDALEGWMRDAGYELESSHDFIDSNFFLVFRCRDC